MTGMVTTQSLRCWAVIVSLALTATTFSGECAGRVITVEENGNNSQCLQHMYNDSQPCQSLDHAVWALNESNTIIEVHYSQNFSESVHLHSTAHNLTIRGMSENISIHCTHRGDGLAFSHQSAITIQRISWINCAFLHISTAMSVEIFNNTDFIRIYSGLFFHNVTNLTIDSCLFTTQRGVGLALFDVGGHVNILNTIFINNSIATEDQCPLKIPNVSYSTTESCSPLGGGLYIELTRCGFKNCPNFTVTVSESKYIIDQCTFQSNNKPAAFINSSEIILGLHNTWWPFGVGGGMALNVRGENRNNSILITNTIFDSNTACNAGGMILSLRDSTHNNSVEFINVTFASNIAEDFDGGAIRTVQHPGRSGNISFTNVSFINNSALSGGGSDHVLTYNNNVNYNCALSTVYFYNCRWHNNTATKAGAALQGIHVSITEATTVGKMFFHNAVFQGNAIPRLGGDTVRYGQGSLYSLGVQIEFSGETVINGSVGTAVVISSTELILGGDVLFANNQGLQGGALYLDGVSWITLRQGLNLTFQHNDAFEAGAAIYCTYESSRTFNISSTCFVQYENRALPPSEWDVSVSFSDNNAIGGGNAVYLTGSPDCYWLGEGFLFESTGGKFNFSDNRAPVISTSANIIYFDNTSSLRLVDGYYMVDLMPGRELFVPVTVQDYFNSSKITATLDAKCFNFTLFTQNLFYGDYCSEETVFRFYGSRVLTINSSLSGVTLGGKENNSDLIIVFKTLEAQPLVLSLRIHFTYCENGYVYNDTSKTCDCYDNGDGILRCFSEMKNVSTQIPCIRSGYWFGTLSSENSAYITASCPAPKCRTRCYNHCLNLDSWCKLPPSSADLCINHHSGPLCALCKPGYSLGYDGLFCIPNNRCNTRSTILLIFFIILFWAVIITGLLLTFRVNFQIGSGYIYAFVYYFSILPYISSSNLQNLGFNTFVAIFLGVAHLDPEFLSYTNLCFDADWGLTQIQMTFFQYIHPVSIGAIIYLLLLLNRRCCHSIFTQSSLIHILCIILLLSYTSLFQTSINLTVPITFHDNPYVRIQPDTKYGDPIHHLPYLLVAIIVECVLVIPFAVVLLLAPWLMRCRIFTRLKPIIDEYQACYQSKYRWFAGYYLINRQLVALTVSVFTNQGSIVLSQQFLNTGILLIHAYIQPYKEKWLNFLDTVFLLDLTLLSFLNGPTTTSTFSTASSLTTIRVLQYLLIIVPCLYFIIACTVIISIRVRMWYNERRQKIRWGPFVWQETTSRRGHPFKANQPSGVTTEYDELVDESLSVEMSTRTRETLGTRGDRLITHTRTTKDYSETNSEEVFLIPPSSSTPRLIQKVVGSLSSQVQYWRRSRTLSEDSVREKEIVLNSDRSSLSES